MFIFKSGKEDRSAWAEVFMFIHSGADLFTGLAFICSHPSLPFSFSRSFLSSYPFISPSWRSQTLWLCCFRWCTQVWAVTESLHMQTRVVTSVESNLQSKLMHFQTIVRKWWKMFILQQRGSTFEPQSSLEKEIDAGLQRQRKRNFWSSLPVLKLKSYKRLEKFILHSISVRLEWKYWQKRGCSGWNQQQEERGLDKSIKSSLDWFSDQWVRWMVQVWEPQCLLLKISVQIILKHVLLDHCDYYQCINHDWHLCVQMKAGRWRRNHCNWGTGSEADLIQKQITLLVFALPPGKQISPVRSSLDLNVGGDAPKADMEDEPNNCHIIRWESLPS